ncbi:hypothetical protein M0813_11173 [Anaeramoeba flamelloides]|uniref:Myb-like DNA-binding domain protein n=1 Tax=Anaeramoeba flamelloides TaxID=1746091 RepID=A0ABQ8ZFW5_9EUKA|nr:hypothetical protein M0813_11173 [Anaeramoeba flamelloides]
MENQKKKTRSKPKRKKKAKKKKFANRKQLKNSIWSEHEDNKLEEIVKQYKGKNWSCVASYFKNKDATQCLHRWQKVLNPKVKKGRWSKEEDQKFNKYFKKYGENWSTIAKKMRHRTSKQCRERWKNVLDPNLQRTPWTIEEDKIILEKYEELGPKWSKIKKFLTGRSDNQIKNHFNCKLKKINKNLEKDYNPKSKFNNQIISKSSRTKKLWNNQSKNSNQKLDEKQNKKNTENDQFPKRILRSSRFTQSGNKKIPFIQIMEVKISNPTTTQKQKQKQKQKHKSNSQINEKKKQNSVLKRKSQNNTQKQKFINKQKRINTIRRKRVKVLSQKNSSGSFQPPKKIKKLHFFSNEEKKILILGKEKEDENLNENKNKQEQGQEQEQGQGQGQGQGQEREKKKENEKAKNKENINQNKMIFDSKEKTNDHNLIFKMYSPIQNSFEFDESLPIIDYSNIYNLTPFKKDPDSDFNDNCKIKQEFLSPFFKRKIQYDQNNKTNFALYKKNTSSDTLNPNTENCFDDGNVYNFDNFALSNLTNENEMSPKIIFSPFRIQTPSPKKSHQKIQKILFGSIKNTVQNSNSPNNNNHFENCFNNNFENQDNSEFTLNF